jgi:hypothetical protein
MAAYGAGTPEEMYRMQAESEVEQQKQAQKMKQLQAAGQLADSIYNVAKQNKFDPEVIAGIKSRSDIAQAVSPLYDLSQWNPTAEGEEIVATESRPAIIDGKESMTAPGQALIKLPDGSFKTRLKTAKDVALEQRGKAADSTALMKNARYLSKQLKIPEDEAVKTLMKVKGKSREDFISSFISRAVSTQGTSDKVIKRAHDAAVKVYDDVYGAEEAAPQAVQDVVDADIDTLLGGM